MTAKKPNYDRLYILLNLEPGRPLGEIIRSYRQLAQIFHSDKWKYPTPASTKWAEERFKEIKEAKDILEDHWSRHGVAPPSAAELDPAALQRLESELARLKSQKAALETEIRSVRAEHERATQSLHGLGLERDKLHLEVSGLRTLLEEAHQDVAGVRAQIEAEMARPFTQSPLEPRLAYQWAFTYLDDPEKGALLRFGVVIAFFIIVWSISGAITDALFGMFYLEESWRWVPTLFEAVLTIGINVLVLGWAWAQWTLYVANKAGRRQTLALSPAQTWAAIVQALRDEGHYGSQWEFLSGAAPAEMCVEMRASLRFSIRAHPLTRRLREQVVTVYCRTGVVGPQQTSLVYRFELAGAPFWWLLPAARVVRAAGGRLADHKKLSMP
jgi:hypothetical protein